MMSGSCCIENLLFLYILMVWDAMVAQPVILAQVQAFHFIVFMIFMLLVSQLCVLSDFVYVCYVAARE